MRLDTILLTIALARPSAAAPAWNGIARASRGHVYVVDAEDGHIWRIAPDGEVRDFVSGEAGIALNHPHHLAIDEQDQLWRGSG